MPAFREVTLAAGTTGRLFLHSMPGRQEPLEEVWHQLQTLGISAIVNLAFPRRTFSSLTEPYTVLSTTVLAIEAGESAR